MAREYSPRRASKRWLEGAPEYILDCFDHPKEADRYTIIFGGSLVEGNGTRRDTWLHYLALDDSGAQYSGEFEAHDAAAYRYANKHRRVAWSALPEHIRQRAVKWAETE